ncbi:antirestriction protein, partial [Escherichia coli]|uniref:antirestriction protein n=1 Tax=Escherichia coli TaxID=562 RepID=UPI0025A1DB16
MQYAKPVTLNVEECDRLSFLPYLFGNDFLYAEAYVYALAKKMMPEYQGGFWHFIRLPDGGGYMMPDGDRFHMVNGANWFDRTVSIRRQLVLPTRANYTGRTLQCDIKSRLLLPSLSFSCSFHLSVR